jgi:hypothetical protein
MHLHGTSPALGHIRQDPERFERLRVMRSVRPRIGRFEAKLGVLGIAFGVNRDPVELLPVEPPRLPLRGGDEP